MITITKEWLMEHWPELERGQPVPVRLSAWDEGDAFTLASLGQLPSPITVEGRVVLGYVEAPDAPVLVRLEPARSGMLPTGGLGFEGPNGARYIVTGQTVVSGVAVPIDVSVVEAGREVGSRRFPMLETDVLSEASVLIVGLGTGGAYVAVELAKCGVGEFVLVDSDRIDVGNVSRHLAGVSHAGRRKVFVVRDLIREANPLARVEAHPIAATPNSEQVIRRLIDKVQLVVCATDTRSSKLFINRLSTALSRVAIYGGAFSRAHGGQVLRVRPGRSPCYQCFVLAMPEEEADREISSDEEAQLLAYSDRPVAPEPGLSLDVAPISHMVAKLALQELLQGKESALRVLDRDFSAPWYLWVNRPEKDTPYHDWPPLSEAVDEMTILRWYGVDFDREAGCPACGDFDRASRQAFGLPDGELPSIEHRPAPLQGQNTVGNAEGS